MADPMWTMDAAFRPHRTERDGLAFVIRYDGYGRPYELKILRAADDALIESVYCENHDSARHVLKIVKTWDLEAWRASEEAKALERVEAALTKHRDAMTRLNEVRAVRV